MAALNETSLCAKVLKGKYYADGDFLNATKKRKSSETWQAILYGRDALVKGLIKRVGPGNINIWSENWLGHSSQRRPLTRSSGGPRKFLEPGPTYQRSKAVCRWLTSKTTHHCNFALQHCSSICTQKKELGHVPRVAGPWARPCFCS